MAATMIVTRKITFGAGIVVGAAGLYFGLCVTRLLPSHAAIACKIAPPVPPPTARLLADDDYHLLLQHPLHPPISSANPEELRDTFSSPRPGGKTHEALDIPAPRGTPVHAFDDGIIARLVVSQKGGISIYQLDAGETYCYYYAHLARYANRLRVGMTVKHGDVIGYVGTSGDAPANGPHLHLSITRVRGELWEGAPINPLPLLLAISDDIAVETN
jgi:peptidoglycan LD-endopeptidase LytH